MAPAGYATFEWSNDSTNVSIDVTEAGMYSVIASTLAGCVATDTATLVLNDLPLVDLGEDVAICEGETTTVDAGEGFTAYEWSTSETSQTLEVGLAGTYSVLVTDANGCQNGDTVAVAVNPLPVVDLGPDTVVIAPAAYVLDAGSGFTSYFWSDGSTEQTLVVLETGTYSVTVVDANGCENTDEVIVTITTSTKEVALAGRVTLFPNPASGWVSLSFSAFEPGAYTATLYDLIGRAVAVRQVDIHSSEQTAEMDLSMLPGGSYFVKIASEKGILVKQLIVE